MRILIVDDDASFRESVRSNLEEAGYEVVEAADGEKALNELAANPMDLIVLDIVMPEKDGFEILPELRRTYPHVKIIAISTGGAGQFMGYLKMAEDMGVDRVLPKPFKFDALLGVIRDLSA